MRAKQVAAVSASIRLPDHDVRVQAWLAIGATRDVARQREDFDLFGDLDRAILLALPLPVADAQVLQRADPREVRARYVVFARKFLDSAAHLIADCENK